VHRSFLIILPAFILVAGFSFARVAHNPPGYYIDEASISYNAYTIAQTGQDEFGTSWPLYFRAFGDYKNPVQIYLLAGIYRFTGPSVMVARLLSATCGVLAASALGLLAWRITRSRMVAIATFLLVGLAPWHFEISRMVLEVALYPLGLALLLLSVHRAAGRSRWNWTDVACVTATLALVTYTYSVGRLLGPVFALGLIFFAARPRRGAVALTGVLYLLTLFPLLWFIYAHPGALSERFRIITYLDPALSVSDLLLRFGRQSLSNLNPWNLFVTGDPNPEQITHIQGTPLLPVAAGILAVMGLVAILRRRGRDPWWRFVIYGLIVAIVPASLTNEAVHMLRLAPLMVFLFVLAIPGLETLQVEGGKRRLFLSVVVVSIVIQGLIFQWQFYATAHSRKRLRQFDHGYPSQIFARAIAMPNRPIYIADALWIPGYIQAYWNAALRHVPINRFVRLAPDEAAPEGAVVISTEENCPRCAVLATSEFYALYLAQGLSIEHEPLSKEGFRAGITLLSPSAILPRGQQASLSVQVKNESDQPWPARERGGGRYQVSLGNHWLDESGKTMINDDGRTALLSELRPGESVTLKLVVNAPRKPGNYILEVDMLQEGVSWFGLKGSATVRLPVRIE
jgi:hypothetical protein